MSKPSSTPSPSEIMHGVEMQRLGEAQAELTQNVEATIEGLVSGDQSFAISSVSMLMGRIQMAEAMKGFATVSSLEMLKNIKETKAYKNLSGLKLPTGSILRGTWEEFCQLIGESRAGVDDRLKNLEAFGKEALEAMQAVGMGIRDLRRLRQLPEDQLSAIIEGDVIKVDSKEEALELIDQLAAKHRAEKAEMQQSIAKLEQDNQSNERLLSAKDNKINELTKRLDTNLTPVERRKKETELYALLRTELSVAEIEIDKGIARFGDAVQTIQDTPGRPTDLDDACYEVALHTLDRMLDEALNLGLASLVLERLERFKADTEVMSGV